MVVNIYCVTDPELISFAHSIGIDGYVDDDGSFYLNESDYQKLIYYDFDGSCIYKVDGSKVVRILHRITYYELHSDAILYFLDGRKAKLYICCVPEYILNKYCGNMDKSEQGKMRKLFKYVYSQIKDYIPEWIAVKLCFDAGEWNHVLAQSYYDDDFVCGTTALDLAEEWCYYVNDYYKGELKYQGIL